MADATHKSTRQRIIDVLNQARCHEERTVGNAELADRIIAAQYEGSRNELNPELPCTVWLSPTTRLNEGVRLTALLKALETRGMSDAPYRNLALCGAMKAATDEAQ